ncbi:hypothetical protein HYALB_00008519 [Hymenoscyphus albidus]|uniref:Uncharacterized protein n=1 Tax=Hymenoscyphus albidus TaxID=595503 RepID=A0A9N9LUV3_9HELO|nr:hypothetical protein HYALB_00008519 [Hymenoscyphus albidus]
MERLRARTYDLYIRAKVTKDNHYTKLRDYLGMLLNKGTHRPFTGQDLSTAVFGAWSTLVKTYAQFALGITCLAPLYQQLANHVLSIGFWCNFTIELGEDMIQNPTEKEIDFREHRTHFESQRSTPDFKSEYTTSTYTYKRLNTRTHREYLTAWNISYGREEGKHREQVGGEFQANCDFKETVGRSKLEWMKEDIYERIARKGPKKYCKMYQRISGRAVN